MTLLVVALEVPRTFEGWLPGMVYFRLGPLQTINGVWWGRKMRADTGARP